MDFEPLIDVLKREMGAAMQTATDTFVANARKCAEGMLAEVEEARARGEAEVAEKRAALEAELAAMQGAQQWQGGRVELDVGGRRFHTSVATLRSKPGNFFDAMFSGRYAMERRTGRCSWTATAPCLSTCWSTSGTAWCRWRRRARGLPLHCSAS